MDDLTAAIRILDALATTCRIIDTHGGPCDTLEYEDCYIGKQGKGQCWCSCHRESVGEWPVIDDGELAERILKALAWHCDVNDILGPPCNTPSGASCRVAASYVGISRGVDCGCACHAL